jgi:hypothetical protein
MVTKLEFMSFNWTKSQKSCEPKTEERVCRFQNEFFEEKLRTIVFAAVRNKNS